MLNPIRASKFTIILYLIVAAIAFTSVLYPFLYPPMPASSTSLLPLLDKNKAAISEVSEMPMPVFSKIENVVEKKKAFFGYLLPEIHRQNEIVANDRDFLLNLKDKVESGKQVSVTDEKKIRKFAKQYRVDNGATIQNMLVKLERKVDVIPVELILVQAANESAWGTSRFARNGYNFFGMWCFNKGCGFVPKQRNSDADHEVEKFNNLRHAINTYVANLNRHPAYKELRDIRHKLRQNNDEITAEKLVQGLDKYSERGQDYIDELLEMLRFNRKFMDV